MRFFEFTTTNGRKWYLVTEKTGEEVEEEMRVNDWITLWERYDFAKGGGEIYTSGEVDVQVDNVVSKKEDKDVMVLVEDMREKRKRKKKIVEEILQYRLSGVWKMAYIKKTLSFGEWSSEEEKLLDYKEEYLIELLDWVREKGVKKNKK